MSTDAITNLKSETTEQLLTLRKELVSKINANDGRLTAGSSMDLDHWLDQLEETESELFSRRRMGQLARDWCNKKLPLVVLKTCGYYIGTFDPESGPCSRESVEYFSTESDALVALETGVWTQKQTP
jgi:hypothetical protein